MKTCTKCGESKPLEDFYKAKLGKDGVEASCKDCVSVCKAAYYAANKEKLKARSASYEAANKDRHNATNARWYAVNKNRKYLTNAAWAKANPEKTKLWEMRRRARKADNGENLVTQGEIAAIIAQPCMACDSPAPSTLEHLIPVNRGGAHTIGNLAPLCQSCNSSKHDLLWIEWKHSNRAQARKVFAA
tara:strand:+ start:141 stop:704 length:564 start_codon:yes stop_codon:yes gene_type:complete